MMFRLAINFLGMALGIAIFVPRSVGTLIAIITLLVCGMALVWVSEIPIQIVTKNDPPESRPATSFRLEKPRVRRSRSARKPRTREKDLEPPT